MGRQDLSSFLSFSSNFINKDYFCTFFINNAISSCSAEKESRRTRTFKLASTNAIILQRFLIVIISGCGILRFLISLHFTVFVSFSKMGTCVPIFLTNSWFRLEAWFCVYSFLNKFFWRSVFQTDFSILYLNKTSYFFPYCILFSMQLLLIYLLTTANFSLCVFHVACSINSFWQNLLGLTHNVFAIIFRFLCEHNAK